jgi:hypothetical protein
VTLDADALNVAPPPVQIVPPPVTVIIDDVDDALTVTARDVRDDSQPEELTKDTYHVAPLDGAVKPLITLPPVED